MPIGSTIARIAQAFLDMQRAKLGIPGEEQKATASADASMLRRAQAAKALQEVQLEPSERASQAKLREAQTGALTENAASLRAAREAQAILDRAKASTATSKSIERTVDLGDKVEYVYTDGTREIKEKGATPRAAGRTPPEPGRLSPLLDKDGNVIGTFHNVTGEVKPIQGATPGQPAKIGDANARKSPLPAAMQQVSGMAKTVNSNIDQMDKIADAVVAGPVTGHISKASQAVFGPHGPEGAFDFLGNAAVDLVYIKSGKQINEGEMKILKGMIPNRARGNLKEQVRLFREYANGLLRQYGASEDSAPSGSGAISPNVEQRLKRLREQGVIQ